MPYTNVERNISYIVPYTNVERNSTNVERNSTNVERNSTNVEFHICGTKFHKCGTRFLRELSPKSFFLVNDKFDRRRGIDDRIIFVDVAFGVRRKYDVLFRNKVGLENTIAVLLYVRVP